MMKQFLEIGRITSTHGIRGEMRVQPWCDTPQFLTRFSTLYLDGQGKNAVRVERARAHQNMVILKISGVDTAEQAQCYRGKLLFHDRNDVSLPQNSYYIQDLLGCKVLDADNGVCYGTLTDVSETGANDVWQVTDGQGKDYLLPAIPSVIVETKPEEERITIRPIKGIFDDED